MMCSALLFEEADVISLENEVTRSSEFAPPRRATERNDDGGDDFDLFLLLFLLLLLYLDKMLKINSPRAWQSEVASGNCERRVVGLNELF